MTNAFIEPSQGGGYQIEFSDDTSPKRGFSTQADAIEAARKMGRKPLVARVRELNDKAKPDQWRSA